MSQVCYCPNLCSCMAPDLQVSICAQTKERYSQRGQHNQFDSPGTRTFTACCIKLSQHGTISLELLARLQVRSSRPRRSSTCSLRRTIGECRCGSCTRPG